MVKEIILLVVFFGAGVGFVYFKNYLTAKKDNPTLQEPKEPVSGKKFLSGMFSFFNPVLWLKDISSLFNLRKIVIYLLIVAGIFIYGYVKGKSNLPVSVKLGYGKEAVIEINADKDYLHIDKNGNVWVKDKDDNVLKQIKAKDIPTLKGYLAPYALQLKPIFVAGGSAGASGTGAEIGAGFSFARLWKMNLETFITSYPAVYLGTSYSISDNSGIG